MGRTKLDERFFDSTRGRVVTMLRAGERTVEELAGELGLTDNAVRAHLSTLERDGLVRQRGVRRGFRKPHLTYALTREAEHLFPKAYDVLLNQLITVLKGRLGREGLEDALREVGRALAGPRTQGAAGSGRRIRQAVNALSVPPIGRGRRAPGGLHSGRGARRADSRRAGARALRAWGTAEVPLRGVEDGLMPCVKSASRD
jgi:DNA-binding transcriptional ArsR family regulator